MELNSWNRTDVTHAPASKIKLPENGYRHKNNDNSIDAGTYGDY